MFRFTIRELVLLTLIVGLSLGWSLDHRQLLKQRDVWQMPAKMINRDYDAATGKSPQWEVLGKPWP